jgi:hypothetical protein
VNDSQDNKRPITKYDITVASGKTSFRDGMDQYNDVGPAAYTENTFITVYEPNNLEARSPH